MKTDELISMLGTNVERVDRQKVVRTLAAAILVGLAAAFCVMLFVLGVRTDLPKASAATYLPL